MKNIVLIGFMGAGKSSVGQALSTRMGCSFVDIDDLIEKQSQMAIADIFSKYGERYFRALEMHVVQKSVRRKGQIIATGGGAIVSKKNRELLRKGGHLVYLKADINVLWRRICGTSHRPLLKGIKQAAMRALFEQREPLYHQADFIVRTEAKTVMELAKDIQMMIRQKETLSTISVGLGRRSYEIQIGSDILGSLPAAIKRVYTGRRVCVITNTTVKSLYGGTIQQILKDAGFQTSCVAMSDGERYKNDVSLQKIYDHLVENSAPRDSLIIALGGGVVGDVAGYAAATYMRGLPLIQIPTTLLAQVDSSVGGKTGINHPKGKNLIGAFYQPKLVFIDAGLLKTLAKRELRAGLAEVIKYGIIWDRFLFRFLEKNITKILKGDMVSLCFVIQRSCEIKGAVVEKDEREQGLRAILNFGHTLGHAIEAATHYKRYLHGEAIAIGMVLAAEISVNKGFLKKKDYHVIRELFRRVSLPVSLRSSGIKAKRILSHVWKDKKVRSGVMRFVVARGIGRVEISSGVTEDDITKVL